MIARSASPFHSLHPILPGRRLVCGLLALILLVGFTSPQCVSARESQPLMKLLQQSSENRHYEPASANSLAEIEDRFLRTLQLGHQLSEAMIEEWRAAGWVARELEFHNERCIVIHEEAQRSRGWGFFVLRPKSASRIVLQMPHSFSDQRTREIGMHFFYEGSFAAACWNTVPRKIVDVAHVVEHPFSAFTRAMARYRPDLYFVQIHGFDPSSRKTAENRVADLIVSNGNDAPESMVRKTSVLMESAFPFLQVRLYPAQIQELGATTNVQAELLRQLGSRQFIHFEMSRTLRTRMANDSMLRQVFLKNLNDGVE